MSASDLWQTLICAAPMSAFGGKADCSLLVQIRTPSRYSSRLRAEIRHGEAGGLANRLGERKLELRRRISASRFCLHLCWNGALARAHNSRLCVDSPSVRYGIFVLDLLSARPAAADVGQGA